MLKIQKKIKEFSQVYSDYYPVVYGVVFSKLRNNETTQDLCQEIFTRMYVKFDEIRNYRTWLFGTMRLVLLEYYREKHHNHVAIDDVFNDVNLTYLNAFKDTRLILEEAMQEMQNFGDEKNRIIFEMVTIRNLTYKETAQQLGISINQVRYRLERITERFIDYLRSKGINSLEELL
jgi:RNA polymerase sigma factor (sigma-70 family)